MIYFYNAFGNFVLLNNIETFSDTNNINEENVQMEDLEMEEETVKMEDLQIEDLEIKINELNLNIKQSYIELLDLQKKILNVNSITKKIRVRYNIDLFKKKLDNMIETKNKIQNILVEKIVDSNKKDKQLSIFIDNRNTLIEIKKFLISIKQIKDAVPIEKENQHELLTYSIKQLKVLFVDLYNIYAMSKNVVENNTDYNIDEETTDNEFMLNSFL